MRSSHDRSSRLSLTRTLRLSITFAIAALALVATSGVASPVLSAAAGTDDPVVAKKVEVATPVDGISRFRKLEDFNGALAPGTDLAGRSTQFLFYSRYLPSSASEPSVRGRRGVARYEILCKGFDRDNDFVENVVDRGRGFFDSLGNVVINVVVTPDVPCTLVTIEIDYRGTLRMIGPGSMIETFVVNPLGGGACRPGPNTLCLQDGRFEVDVEWAGEDRGGMGVAVPDTVSQGLFWLFDPDDTELLVKILDGCSSEPSRFQVFAAGLTDLELDLTVTDTENGQERSYMNPLGRPLEPIVDTRAFATCP